MSTVTAENVYFGAKCSISFFFSDSGARHDSDDSVCKLVITPGFIDQTCTQLVFISGRGKLFLTPFPDVNPTRVFIVVWIVSAESFLLCPRQMSFYIQNN